MRVGVGLPRRSPGRALGAALQVYTKVGPHGSTFGAWGSGAKETSKPVCVTTTVRVALLPHRTGQRIGVYIHFALITKG